MKNSKNNTQSSQSCVMGGYDYVECVVEELKLNGFDVRVIQGKHNNLIEFDTIAGRMKYACAFSDNYMKDYFRFIQILGQRLSKYGLESRLSLDNLAK